MIGSCEWDQGATDAQGTLYSCTMCDRTKYVPNPDHVHKVSEEWYPSSNADDTHYKSCFCGDESTIYEANCRWDEGYVMEDDNTKYTCLDCGRERIQIFHHEHEIGDWTADVTSDNKHVKTCYCGDESATIYGDCSWTKVSESEYELVYMCNVCHRIKREFKEHEHIFGSYWYYANDKHSRECNVCSETEFFDCIYTGVPIKGPSQYNRNDVLYLTCSDCKNVKTVEVYPSGSLTGTQGDLSIKIPTGGSAYLAQGSQFVVDKLTLKPSNEEMTAIKGAVDQQARVLAQYDLALLYNGVSVQPGGKVLITVPKVENADKYGAITVVYVDESGSVTKCNTTQNADGSITFEAQHFSRYVIVATPKDGAPVGLIISIAVSAVIVSGAIAFAVIKIVLTKKKK